MLAFPATALPACRRPEDAVRGNTAEAGWYASSSRGDSKLSSSAMEPRRVRGVVTTFVLGLLVWGVLSLVVAGVREHTDL